MISISQDDLVLQGRPVARVEDLMDPGVSVIDGLKDELEYQASRKGEIPEGGYEITIMGDKELPYWLLKKVMLTSQTTDFARISLAVNKLQGMDDPAALEAAAQDTASVAQSAEVGGAS